MLPEVREKPCRRGHDVELSYWRDYWRCRGCDREWNAAARERAKAAPKPPPSEVREKPCRRGHDVELSAWGDDGRWHCRGCQRQWTKRWAAENPGKRKANQAVQDERRKARREAAKPSPEAKILRRLAEGSTTNAATGCREWQGKLERGYGRIGWKKRTHYTHRLAWQLLRSTIPDGMVIDHLCHNRRCVEPTHLRLTSVEGNSANKYRPIGDDRMAVLWDRLKGIPGTHLIRG